MDNLKMLRQKAGLTQSQVSKLLGVRQSTVSNWETRGSTPRAAKLQKLSRLYGCTIDDLFQDEPNA